jgi:hypothetical protein
VADVFISYKRESLEQVERLSGVLRDLSLSVWFDASIHLGEAWAQRILHELDQASVILVCWTPDAMLSDWVLREAQAGFDRDVLAQVKLETCTPPAPFNDQQIGDLIDWEGSDLTHPALKALLARIEKLTGVANLVRNAHLRAGGQHDELVAMLRALLVERARAGAIPMTYAEAERAIRAEAERSGLEIGEFSQISLWGALDSIAEQNRQRREPPLGALIGNEQGMPGRGYWQKHVFLEGVAEEDFALQVKVLKRQRAWARVYPWPQDV